MSKYKDNQAIKEKLKRFESIYDKLEQKSLEGKFYLNSIVSLGINCGSSTPGVYLDINYHKKWILEIVSFDDQKFKL